MAQQVTTIERDGLKMHVFVSAPTVFTVTSVVLESEGELALVDAQFSRDNAHHVAQLIEGIGKPLKTIFISHSDPDFYFGLDHIADHFPEAKVVSTPQTAWLIAATKDEKLAVWAPQLGAGSGEDGARKGGGDNGRDGAGKGDGASQNGGENKVGVNTPNNAPEKIVVPTPLVAPDGFTPADHFMVGRHRVEIRHAKDDGGHSWLWIPDARTILGGVYLFANQHVWVADAQSPDDRRKWLAALDDMASLRPEVAIPAHPGSRAASGTTHGNSRRDSRKTANADAIGFTRKYLLDLEKVLGESKNSTGSSATTSGSSASAGPTGSAEVIAKMRYLHPHLAAEDNLEMSAKVLTGEMAWKTVRAFPAIGRVARVNFGGEYIFDLYFTAASLSFKGLAQRAEGRPTADTMPYTATEVAPGVWMVYWTEHDNTHVVHVEDYNFDPRTGLGAAWTNIVAPDGSFTNLGGTLAFPE